MFWEQISNSESELAKEKNSQAEVKKLKLLLVTVGGISELRVTSCLAITRVLVMGCRTLPGDPVSPETLACRAEVVCDGLSHLLAAAPTAFLL